MIKTWAVHNLVGHPLMQLLRWMGARRLARLAHDRTAPAIGECEWRAVAWGLFDTGCGRTFWTEDDSPTENGFVYCPFCGHPIEEAEGDCEDVGI